MSEIREIIGNTITTPTPQLTEDDVKRIIAETGGTGEGGIIVDEALDYTSTRPIQNQAVANKFYEVERDVDENAMHITQLQQDVESLQNNSSTGGGSIIDDSIAAIPNTIARRDMEGKLFAINSEIADINDIDVYISENELINRETLKAYAYSKTEIDGKLDGISTGSGGTGGTIYGDVNTVSYTIAKRDEKARLFANNSEITDPNDIDSFAETELINKKVLQAYATPKISMDPVYDCVYGYDDNGDPMAYYVTSTLDGPYETWIPTVKAVGLETARLEEKIDEVEKTLADLPTGDGGDLAGRVDENTENIQKLLDNDLKANWDLINDKPTTLAGYGITDAYTKTEVDNKIANIIVGDITSVMVDQTYSSESENAQSGKAVAEAITNVIIEAEGVVKTYVDNNIEDITNSIGSITSIDDITSTLSFKQGYYHKDSGSHINAGGKQCTDLFPVVSGEKYIITGNYGYEFGLIAEFDTDNSFIQSVCKDDSGTAGVVKVVDYEYIVPVDVAYIALSYRSSYSSDILIIKKETITLNNVNEQIGEVTRQLEQISDELLDARTSYDGITYSTTGKAVREQIKQVKALCNKSTSTNTVNPLVVDMLADFNWSCNTEVTAFNASGAYIDEVSKTPNNAFFCVSGVVGDDYVTVISGGNASISGISAISSNKPFGAVLKYDDGTYAVCNAWYRDDTTISIYPKLKADITSGELGNLKTGIHLSRRGYEAYAQKIYNTNPKWCEKGSLIVGYRPTQGATTETSPFALYGATGTTVHKLVTDTGLSARKFLYKLLPTAYHFYGAGVEIETESGIEWSVSLDNKNGYMELFIGGSNWDTYDYETDNPVYIDLYLDGELYQQVIKTTRVLERVCIDFANAQTAQLKIYMKKWFSSAEGFSISAISFWENKMHFADTNYLVPKFSTIGQMFDSWGEFHDCQSAKSLAALHNSRCGVTVPYENHSKGSQTTVWGKAWFYENVLKYHPSHMLIDFFINDFNSQGGGLAEATIFGPDNTEYINVVSVDEYMQNIQDIIDMAIVNKIQPIFIGTALHNGYTFEGVDTEPRYMQVWYMRLIDEIRGQLQ